MARKLVLFDVDWTLMTKPMPSFGDRFSVAFKKVFGIDDSNIDKDIHEGKTDRQIVMEVAKEKGVDEKTVGSEMNHVFSVMSKFVEENVEKDNSFHEMLHVRGLLVELEKKGDILGLVTGNVEKIARLKLKKVGLMDFFQLGGFGDSSEKRNELVLIAIKKAEEKSGSKITKKDIFVVGDTPRDIEAGKSAGVRTIAMATGPCPLNELKKHNPDYAFADFSETDKIVRAIHSG